MEKTKEQLIKGFDSYIKRIKNQQKKEEDLKEKNQVDLKNIEESITYYNEIIEKLTDEKYEDPETGKILKKERLPEDLEQAEKMKEKRDKLIKDKETLLNGTQGEEKTGKKTKKVSTEEKVTQKRDTTIKDVNSLIKQFEKEKKLEEIKLEKKQTEIKEYYINLSENTTEKTNEEKPKIFTLYEEVDNIKKQIKDLETNITESKDYIEKLKNFDTKTLEWSEEKIEKQNQAEINAKIEIGKKIEAERAAQKATEEKARQEEAKRIKAAQEERDRIAEELAAEKELRDRLASERKEPEVDEALEYAKKMQQELKEREEAEQAAAEQVAAEQAAAEQAAAEQAAAEQAAAEQVAAEQVIPEQVAAEQVAAEQVAAEQVAAEQVIPEQVVPEQAAAEQVVEEQEVEGEKIPNITNIYISGNDILGHQTNLSEDIKYADYTDYKEKIDDNIMSGFTEEEQQELWNDYINPLIERNKGNNSYAKIFSILANNETQFFNYLNFISCIPDIKRGIDIDNLPKISYIFNDKTNKMKFKQKIELYDEYWNIAVIFKNAAFEDRKLNIETDLRRTQKFFIELGWALKGTIQDIKDSINTKRLERGGDKEVIEAIQDDREEQEAKKEEKPAKQTFRDSLKVFLGKGKNKNNELEQAKEEDKRRVEEQDPEFIPFDQVEEIGRNLTPSEPPQPEAPQQQEQQVDDDEFYTILNDIIKSKNNSTDGTKDNPNDGSR